MPPILVADQTNEHTLRITTIIEQLAVALPMIQGLAEQVNAMQQQQPGALGGGLHRLGGGISDGWGGRFGKS